MCYFGSRNRCGWLCALFLVIALSLSLASPARGQGAQGWQAADAVQKALHQAQIALFSGDSAGALAAMASAERIYAAELVPLAQAESSQAIADGTAALRDATDAAQRNDQPAFAAASSTLQTALYRVGYEQTLAAIGRSDTTAASEWLLLRAFRQVSRFERLNSDATRALAGMRDRQLSPDDARASVQVDLLDTYQARMDAALHDLAFSDTRALAAGRAQHAALAAGYFAILAPAYREQRGDAALGQAQRAFASLLDRARAGQSVAAALPPVESALRGFRAAPLSPAEQTRRAGQLLRFIALVPVEYARGVQGQQVTIPLEIQEAATFRDGAAAAFGDLRSLLDERDPAKTQQAADTLAVLEQQLLAAKSQTHVAAPADIQNAVDQLITLLKAIMPAAWQQHDSAADFDTIQVSLDQMERAAAAKQYELAESARLDAYAVLESGPEAKLMAFAPQLKQPIEELFWYGQGAQPGLASLIHAKASPAVIAASRQALNAQLSAAEQALTGNNAPAAVAANAALIVFREGLEAVLILASLMGSMKIGAQRALRRPLWLGTVLALAASALTWLVARSLLTTLARYGERLEAVVSVIAIAVLLLITNWFFHDVYWTGWMANFHRQKKRIAGGAAQQFIGLIILGFTSIYREGFETVLFLQALVLESGTATVLSGIAVGLAGTLLVGTLVFVVQAKLPHKKMLIFTGILIGAVLLQMVGNTAHVLQVVGWLPIHPISWLGLLLPYWSGLWFGLYATWEGLLLQFAAGAFTIGSYFLAERLHKTARAPSEPRQAPAQP